MLKKDLSGAFSWNVENQLFLRKNYISDSLNVSEILIDVYEYSNNYFVIIKQFNTLDTYGPCGWIDTKRFFIKSLKSNQMYIVDTDGTIVNKLPVEFYWSYSGLSIYNEIVIGSNNELFDFKSRKTIKVLR
ncbi:MAG: hypothetical protein ABIA63_01700 [bacterium]